MIVETQNNKGNERQYDHGLGYNAVWVKERSSVAVDKYEGRGNTYKERDKPLITIQDNGSNVFEGTFDELISKLK